MTDESKQETDKRNMVDIEGTLYPVDELSELARRYFNQVVQCNDDILKASAALERATVTREAFLERLRKELDDG